jgi:hypothetical protein
MPKFNLPESDFLSDYAAVAPVDGPKLAVLDEHDALPALPLDYTSCPNFTRAHRGWSIASKCTDATGARTCFDPRVRPGTPKFKSKRLISIWLVI